MGGLVLEKWQVLIPSLRTEAFSIHAIEVWTAMKRIHTKSHW
jgi:hypothetical protein